MNILGIETFLKIAQLRSITGTAEELHLSQSTVSHRLKLLEEAIGEPLIVRSKGRRSIELTPRGQAFVPLAERWLLLAKDTERFQNGAIERSLTVASIDSINAFVLGPFYREIAGMPGHPLDLDVRTYQSFQVQEMVEKHEIDIGFLVRKHTSRTLIFRPIFQERHVLIGSLGEDESVLIDPRELDPRYEVRANWSPDYLDWHNYYFDSSISPWVEVDTAALALNFFDNPKVWGIVPERAAALFRATAGLHVYRMPNPPPDRVCYQVEHRFPLENKRQAIDQFSSLLIAYLHKTGLRYP